MYSIWAGYIMIMLQFGHTLFSLGISILLCRSCDPPTLLVVGAGNQASYSVVVVVEVLVVVVVV